MTGASRLRLDQSPTIRDVVQVRDTEAQIDRLVAELWGLSQQELEEIQRSLEELG